MLHRINARPRRETAAGLIALVLALGAIAMLPGTAAASVTIGSNLSSTTGASLPGGAGQTWSQRILPSSLQAGGGLTSPINGVVVRWRVKADLRSPPVKLRVIRPGADASEATGAGTSAAGDPQSLTTTSFALNPGLPIRVGDGIGLDTTADSPGEYVHFDGSGASHLNGWGVALTDGGAPSSPFVDRFSELLLQATIEPDKDGDGLGDESQDPDGGNPGVPAFSASPASLSFGNQRVGTTSPASQVTVSNSGTAALSIGSVALTGANPGDYVITSNGCGGQTLAPGGSCSVRSAFRPTAKGLRTASLRFTDNAPGSPHSVALSGRGCAVLIGALCL